ncbi:glycosyltransferase family protein [Rhizobium ruizarguesonis]|uniref:glycosyltransferase family 2 protein n=1 Tax=Rhizobium ruizarguesonis TaxID=2081791 RepID=UPI001FE08086|nr:glycosyltransferase family 2 protein [Rhizobium ruizarguesonis]
MIKQSEPAPVALFVFNRPSHMKLAVSALASNEFAAQTPLFIFSDGARNPEEQKKVDQVRQQTKNVAGFKSLTVVERNENIGLAASIIDGVSFLCEQYGRVIVLEDDLITSPDFLRFMNQGLRLYGGNSKVASIHGYAYPVAEGNIPESYFLRGADCWGWATWARAWRHFEPDGAKLLKLLNDRGLAAEFDYGGNAYFLRILSDQIEGKNNSWAIRWHASAFLANMLTLYPQRSLVANSGFDGSGTHSGSDDVYKTLIGSAPKELKPIEVVENQLLKAKVADFFGKITRPDEKSSNEIVRISRRIAGHALRKLRSIRSRPR